MTLDEALKAVPLMVACALSEVSYEKVLWRKHQIKTTHQEEFDELLAKVS